MKAMNPCWVFYWWHAISNSNYVFFKAFCCKDQATGKDQQLK